MRNYNDPLYKTFRNAVRNRDKHCRWPNCRARKKLQVHHILPWAKFPLLRYAVANGITLCKSHHTYIKGRELQYVEMFARILNEKI